VSRGRQFILERLDQSTCVNFILDEWKRAKGNALSGDSGLHGDIGIFDDGLVRESYGICANQSEPGVPFRPVMLVENRNLGQVCRF
jgi:hypothetical protein